jgi:hypothetical protein
MKELKSIFSHVVGFFKKIGKDVDWKQMAATVLPALAMAAENILTLSGNGEDATIVASVVSKVQNGVAQMSSLVENYNAQTHTTFVSQITAMAEDVKSELGGLLAAGQVKDADLLSNINKYANVITGDLTSLLGMIPKTAAA